MQRSRAQILYSVQMYTKYLISIINRLRLKFKTRWSHIFVYFLRSVLSYNLQLQHINVVVLQSDTDIIWWMNIFSISFEMVICHYYNHLKPVTSWCSYLNRKPFSKWVYEYAWKKYLYKHIIHLRLTSRRAWCGCMWSSNRHRREGWSVVKTENALVHGPSDGRGYFSDGFFCIIRIDISRYFTLSNRLSLRSADIAVPIHRVYA